MMKSQRSATKKLQLASLFRWLAILCFIKLAIFTMILLDMPFPTLLNMSADRLLPRLTSLFTAEKKEPVREAETTLAEAKRPADSQKEVQNEVPVEPAPVLMSQKKTEPAAENSGMAPKSPEAIMAAGQNEKKEQERPVFSAPDIPLPDPLPAPIAEPGTIAPEEKSSAKNEIPVPTLGSVTAAKAAASMPVPTTGPSTSPFTPVEQKVEPEKRTTAESPKASQRPPLPAPGQNPAIPRPDLSRTASASPTQSSPRNSMQMNTEIQELARQQQDMLMLKKQMDDRLKELKDSEEKVKRMLEEAKGVEEQKLKTLIQMYANMKPKTAAKALESMEERTACQILLGMTPKQSGDILSYTNPTVTAKLTELLSRMRIQ